MRERIRDAERLKHILDAIDGIQKNQKIYTTDKVEKDSIIFYGFVKYLEIIGEAVYMLTKEFRSEHPEVDWSIIEKMRHVLVHGYYQIQPGQLWETINGNLPILKPKIEMLYHEELAKRGPVLEEPLAPYGDIWSSDNWKDSSLLDIIRIFNIEYEDDRDE